MRKMVLIHKLPKSKVRKQAYTAHCFAHLSQRFNYLMGQVQMMLLVPSRQPPPAFGRFLLHLPPCLVVFPCPSLGVLSVDAFAQRRHSSETHPVITTASSFLSASAFLCSATLYENAICCDFCARDYRKNLLRWSIYNSTILVQLNNACSTW